MPPTKTHETALHELGMLSRRIKEARTSDDLRRLLNLMNDLRSRVPDDSLVMSKYNFLRGALYIKGAGVHGNWIASGGESLYYALDLLQQASEAVKEIVSRSSTDELVRLQQDCVYEAMVAVTTLRAWGRNLPENWPDTGCMPLKTQQVIARHLSHGYPLRSRFA